MAGGPVLEFETPERVAVALELAGVGARAYAWLLDALFIFLAWVTALLLYSISGDLVREVQALSIAGQVLAALSVLLAGWGWDVAWEALWGGRTPGKRLASIRVVRSDGGPVGLTEALVRNALRAVELPLAYAPAILAVALSARRQRLGDLVAGTLVVRQARFDLSRYDLPATALARFPQLRGRAAAALSAEGFERLADFLRRRPALEPGARARVAVRLAAALAARASVAPPAAGEAEGFLEALAAAHAEGR
ncbi:MAG TPA: RDD family protein [Anaeromyxobacter sp.]|nr:RDD family protein [Anaeromyxobacter sp.]